MPINMCTSDHAVDRVLLQLEPTFCAYEVLCSHADQVHGPAQDTLVKYAQRQHAANARLTGMPIPHPCVYQPERRGHNRQKDHAEHKASSDARDICFPSRLDPTD